MYTAHMPKAVVLYTDGYCEPNPGPGGYGVVLLFGSARRELSSGFALTTNNRMELMGVIAGLEALKEPCTVTLYSDSLYVVEGITIRQEAKKSRSAKNQDLWLRLAPLLEKHEVRANWVKGHAGIPENEACDRLAAQAAKGANLTVDHGYLAKNTEITRGGKLKITAVGQPCRKCGTPVVKQFPRKADSGGKQFTYAYYLWCPNCRAMYMQEEAKIYPGTSGSERV
jgi:ribonuclease HI